MKGLFAMVLVVAASAGCGGGPVVGTTRVEAPLSDVVRAHKALVVVGASPRGEWAPDAKAIAAFVVPRLQALGYFAAVVDEAGAARTEVDLELRVTITKLSRVTAADRKAKGDGAGPAEVVTTTRLLDRTNGAEIGRARIAASGYEGPRGGTTEDADYEVARRVVALVSGRPVE
ncbi:MAG TPA: DUF4410 domain-containing protein [Minicystis sp.]|nr:DUF4410 domain-containing protein [Minicystis sp.]